MCERDLCYTRRSSVKKPVGGSTTSFTKNCMFFPCETLLLLFIFLLKLLSQYSVGMNYSFRQCSDFALVVFGRLITDLLGNVIGIGEW